MPQTHGINNSSTKQSNFDDKCKEGHSFSTYTYRNVRTEGGRGSSALRMLMYCCHSDVIICTNRVSG